MRETYCVEGVIVTLGDWGERCGTEKEEGGYVEGGRTRRYLKDNGRSRTKKARRESCTQKGSAAARLEEARSLHSSRGDCTTFHRQRRIADVGRLALRECTKISHSIDAMSLGS